MNNNLNILSISLEEYQKLNKRETLIIIPCGCIENHGHHLPLGTDCLLPLAFCHKINSMYKSLLTPTINYGADSVPNCGGGFYMEGTLSISGKQFVKQLKKIVDCYLRDGFCKFLFINGHLENKMFINNAVFDLYKDGIDDEKIFLVIDYWELIDEKINKIIFGNNEVNYDSEHGGVLETSLMLYLYPKLVKDHKNQTDKILKSEKYTVINNNIIKKCKANNSALLSDPKKSTDKKGYIIFNHIFTEICKIIEFNFNVKKYNFI